MTRLHLGSRTLIPSPNINQLCINHVIFPDKSHTEHFFFLGRPPCIIFQENLELLNNARKKTEIRIGKVKRQRNLDWIFKLSDKVRETSLTVQVKENYNVKQSNTPKTIWVEGFFNCTIILNEY